MNKYILYFHINNTTGQVFYVGIGNSKRPYKTTSRNELWHNIVNKYGYDVIIEEINLTWEEACITEMYWIKRIGRRDLGKGSLVNMTDGGEGRKCFKTSENTKKLISESLLGIKRKPMSQETKDKIRKFNLGKPSNNKGKKTSEESKKKMSEARKGKIPWNKGLKLKQN